LRIDLSSGHIAVEEPDDLFYRMYVGGSCLGAYYLLKEMPPGLDAFDPANVLVFATGPATGAAISGASRFNITAKSPLTRAIGDTQAGGFWGDELKRAGFDAIVVVGQAEKPVYLWIQDGEVELRDAARLWGLISGEAQALIREELGDQRIRVALIGPAGENRVRYACVINELEHVNGRTGMGAVMGSKNLKAIAVRGRKSPPFYDKQAIARLARWGVRQIPEISSVANLQALGTANIIMSQQDARGLPTQNFVMGAFEGAEAISGERMRDTILLRNESCYACAVRCKRVVGASEPYEIDSDYGGPEYESIASLGSYLLIDDLPAISKANELCNKYTLDTISTGATIAFAMECFENGILTTSDTDGIELRFGNTDALLQMIEKIARRDGIGDVLAEGIAEAAKVFGQGAERFAMESKGNPFPAHMPRAKPSLCLAYAVSPFGADHQSSEHDYFVEPGATELTQERATSLGLLWSAEPSELNLDKVRLYAYTQWAYGMLDSLDLCQFCFSGWGLYSFDQVVELVRAATGWSTSLWELMKLGERRTNLLRAFNAREGFTRADDRLPERVFEPLIGGDKAGQATDREQWVRALENYYRLVGWDVETGNPTRIKLAELGWSGWPRS
jgi:aldehyde:ferredoxin oxidoreductase